MYFATDPITMTTAALVASVLMILSGMGKNRLRRRYIECPVCHHPRGSCTCRWL
jgi:hypothetical protein